MSYSALYTHIKLKHQGEGMEEATFTKKKNKKSAGGRPRQFIYEKKTVEECDIKS